MRFSAFVLAFELLEEKSDFIIVWLIVRKCTTNSPVYTNPYLINLFFGQAPDCQGEKMNERVVNIINVTRMTPNVKEKTGETCKTAWVLKGVYNGINENKMKVSEKKKKKKKIMVSPIELFNC